MACTSRLAAAHARSGGPEAKSFVRGFGGMRLLRLVGKGRALQLILTADAIDATEAHRNGLVNGIVDADQLVARAETILERSGGKNAPLDSC
ncbi:enoyl-CoA hydratase-related protein [Variovorax ureilyticus]|uniref:Enoyl-CoA hydratase-related protein n=1 Tax=Variovorax ureilyticus TaxID=1836198 RepID=A0ABU8VQY3_9BURK